MGKIAVEFDAVMRSFPHSAPQDNGYQWEIIPKIQEIASGILVAVPHGKNFKAAQFHYETVLVKVSSSGTFSFVGRDA